MPRSSAPADDRRGERVLAAALEARGETRARRLRRVRRHERDRDEARLALGQRARLVDDERVDLLERLERLGVLDEHARRRAAAGADHDRHRRREAERARAGDDEHRDGVDERVREARLGPERAPRRRTSTTATSDDGGHEARRDHVGEPLDRRAAALRLADHAHDLREQRVACPTRSARITKRAGAVDGRRRSRGRLASSRPGSARR